jgi:4-hydroxyphenylacetate 3-monooxygenase
MALRTGKEYIDSLDDDREVWLDGKQVNVLKHEQLRPCVDAFAQIYDLQHDPKHQDLLVMKSPTTGEPVSLAYLEPRSVDDLGKKRAMIEFLARRSGGTLGRLTDYKAPLLLGLYDIRDDVAKVNPEWRDNIINYVENYREKDLCGTHGFADPPHDRSVDTNFPFLKVVNETSKGITLRGAKAVATLAPFANDFIGLTIPRPGLKPEEVLMFALPINSRNLKIVCRASHTQVKNREDHPLAAHYDEMDAWMIFDDVFVPRDRIFFRDRPDLLPGMFERVVPVGINHIVTRMAIKAEVLLGTGVAIADYMGSTKTPAVQAALFDMTAYLETLRAFLTAAEAQATTTPTGMMLGNRQQLILGRIYGVDHLPKILQRLREICGSSLLLAPGEHDRNNPEIGHLIKTFLMGQDPRTTDRYKMMKLAWDYIADSFGGRQLLFEQYNAQTSPFNKGLVTAHYNFDSVVEVAKKIARVASTRAEVAP